MHRFHAFSLMDQTSETQPLVLKKGTGSIFSDWPWDVHPEPRETQFLGTLVGPVHEGVIVEACPCGVPGAYWVTLNATRPFFCKGCGLWENQFKVCYFLSIILKVISSS